jgi:hypothetical protein
MFVCAFKCVFLFVWTCYAVDPKCPNLCKEGAQPGVSSSLVAPSAPKTSAELQSLTREQVRDWAMSMCEFDAEDGAILMKEKINGIALLLMTEDKLEKYGLKGGPATKLMAKVNALKEQLDGQTGTQCGEYFHVDWSCAMRACCLCFVLNIPLLPPSGATIPVKPIHFSRNKYPSRLP